MLSNTYSLGVFVFCLFVVLLFCFYIWMEQLFKRIPRNTLYISLTAFVLTVYCAFFLLMPDQLAKDIKTVEIERRSSFEALKQPVPPPTWSALGSGVDGRVNAITFDSAGNLYAGGDFTHAGGVTANHIAKWNGSSWSALGSGVNNFVYTIAFDSAGNLYAGGEFTQAGGAPTNYIAKWNGSSWSAIADIGGVVDVFYFDKQGNLYVGGDFYVIDKKGKNNVKIKNIAKLGFK